ncbi:MAG: peptidoglycan editing factor PgeF [Synechococcales cyanobacterium T60_A2020_003]|nr:peptidoglycan editing factor PgeF [Synechococcales cyanobacterium T60_A2020_003]
MHTWHWQSWNDMPYLTCSLLESWAHGFFTQQFSPRVPEELVTVLRPEAQVCRVKQVHGNTVLTPFDLQHPPTATSDADSVLHAADGLVTEQNQQSVWVCTADCVPVLIADDTTGQVAAVHAGWRGTAARIVPAAIACLQAQGSKISNLRVALGPAIAGEVYQVSSDVAAELGASLFPHEASQHPETESRTLDLLAQLRDRPDSPVQDDPEPGKVRVDVRRVNVLQLQQLGLDPEHIAIAPFCTYQQPQHFFSYRRSRQKKVQWSGIVSEAAS